MYIGPSRIFLQAEPPFHTNLQSELSRQEGDTQTKKCHAIILWNDNGGNEEEDAENTKEHELAEYATFCLKYGIKTLQ